MSTAAFSRQELVKFPRLSPEVILLDMVMHVLDVHQALARKGGSDLRPLITLMLGLPLPFTRNPQGQKNTLNYSGWIVMADPGFLPDHGLGKVPEWNEVPTS